MTGQSSVAPRGRPTNFAARREEIIASAVAEIISHGVWGMTHPNVAARLGLTPTAVAYYFRNRDELAVAALATTLDALDEIVLAGERTEGDDTLAALVEAALDIAKGVREGRRRAIPPTHDLRALDHPELNARYASLIRRLAAQIARGSPVRRRFHYGRAVFVLANLSWPWMHNHWLAEWRLRDLDLAGRHIVDLLSNGLLPPETDVAAMAELSPLAARKLPQRRPDQEFLVAATHMISSQGYRGASVEKISAHLKVTKGALYYHHESKDDLVRDCFRRTFEIMWEDIDRAEAAGGDGATVLVRLCASLLARQFGDEPLLRTTALFNLPDQLGVDLAEELRRVKVRLACVLSAGISDRSLRPINPIIGAEYLGVALNTASTLKFWHPTASPSEAARAYLLMTTKGIRAC